MAALEEVLLHSISILHKHMGLIVSSKPCLNCSLKICKKFYTSWIMHREKGIFLFFSVITIFLKTPFCLAFLTLGLSLFHSFIQYGKNVFLKVFDLKGKEFILVVDADLKG